MKKTAILIISLIFLFFSSCDRPECENSNQIFDKYSFDSEEYKAELISQISKYDNIEYWFNKYIEEEGKEYLIVNAQNNSICAKAIIQVNDWNKIEDIKRTKGLGYRGAKLKGLKFDIEKDSIKTYFIYKDIESILD